MSLFWRERSSVFVQVRLSIVRGALGAVSRWIGSSAKALDSESRVTSPSRRVDSSMLMDKVLRALSAALKAERGDFGSGT